VKRGFTLVEVLVSMSIFGMLMVVMTMLYLFGLRSSARSYRELDELATMQGLSAMLTSDLEPGCARGTSISPARDILSVLSAASPEHIVELDDQGHAAWRKYVLYTYGPDSGELRRSEVPIPGAFADGPLPLESQSSQALTVWAATPRPSRLLARHVTSFEAERVSFRLLAVRLTLQQPDKPKRTFECSWRMHN
jgi:prepilin-type N-terminal cleavage/methylation domain-containing protein